MQSYFSKHLFKPIRIAEKPADDLSIIIVIPCFNEPDITAALHSLNGCLPCKGSVEVIIVLNSSSESPAETKAQNERSFQEIDAFLKNHPRMWLRVFVLRDEDLPPKHAGVGLARKIGMDEAAWRFETIGNEAGVIVCLDADCTVAPSYLVAIEEYFMNKPDAKGASIYFEHPLDHADKVLREGILQYELHLRYYVQGLRYAGYPYAFHTVGSCLCVRSDVYQRAGGMNRRKAGEDFYFLHKIIPLGGFGQINTTVVYPSSRVSERVPFGTGKAMKDWVMNQKAAVSTYDIRSFDALKNFIQYLPAFYRASRQAEEKIIRQLPASLQAYLKEAAFTMKLKEINDNVSGLKTFTHRFFNWLDGFRVLKMIHFLSDNFYPRVLVSAAAAQLMDRKHLCHKGGIEDLLDTYRKLDKSD